MSNFKQIENFNNTFFDFKIHIDDIYKTLLNTDYDLSKFKNILDKFSIKTSDFLDKDRLFNIGIIGQVKSGRSTFLNSLLFENKDILPSSCIPKTVNITRILYSRQNYIEIFYYTKAELEEIVASNPQKYANLHIQNSIRLENIFKKKSEIIKCNNYTEFEEKLNNFVGQDGLFSDFVKDITLYVDNPNIKNICIFDTPGLNDSIQLRKTKTLQALELCDIVFFLSRGSQFLDYHDFSILKSIISEKSIKNLMIICSRFDDAINDVLPDYKNIDDAYYNTKQRLIKHSMLVHNELVNYFDLNQKSDENIIKNFKSPIFVSSFTFNMSKKHKKDYTKSEAKVYDNLCYYDNVCNSKLLEISGFDQINSIYAEILSKKQEIFENKYISFIPDCAQSLIYELNSIKNIVENRINFLQLSNTDDISTQKQILLAQINNTYKNFDKVLDEILLNIKENKNIIMLKLLKEKQSAKIIKKENSTQDIIVKTLIDRFVWYNPTTWGKKQTKKIRHQENISIIKVSEALKNIRSFSKTYTSHLDKIILDEIEEEKLKAKLISTFLQSTDTSSKNYDPNFYKTITQNTISKLNIPNSSIDTKKFIDIITNKFKKDIQNTSDKIALESLLALCIENLSQEIDADFSEKIDNLHKIFASIKKEFYDEMLINLDKEFCLIFQEIKNKDFELKKNKNFLKNISLQIDILNFYIN